MHDNPLVIGETTIQARHVTELRDAINAVRAHFNLPNYPWAKPTVSGGAINTSVAISWEAIDEMRTALNQTLGPPTKPYAAGLAANQPVKAIHIQELRDRVTNTWSLYGSSIAQAYDGDGLRVKKTQNGDSTYYLRSAVLGGQVIAELNYDQQAGWFWSRGYVYSGSNLLAVQEGGVFWIYEDPVTKSKRVCDANGNTVSGVETDPFGADTSRSFSQAFQPKRFTSYDRDANGSDEAMFRRYNRWHSRFDQPDPSDGSYSFANPQSLNRYAYTQNDPANFVDPSGLIALTPRPSIGTFTVTVTGSWDDMTGYLPNWTSGITNILVLRPLVGPGEALSAKDQRKFDAARNKALNRAQGLEKKNGSKCADFLGRAGISLTDLRTAINNINAFDGGRSTNTSIGEAGVIDLQDPEFMNYSAEQRQAVLSSPVSSLFLRGSRFGAVTGSNGSVFFNTRSGLNSSSVFHEALHVASGLGDVRLAQALGLKFSGGAMGASQAINEALHKFGCL